MSRAEKWLPPRCVSDITVTFQLISRLAPEGLLASTKFTFFSRRECSHSNCNCVLTVENIGLPNHINMFFVHVDKYINLPFPTSGWEKIWVQINKKKKKLLFAEINSQLQAALLTSKGTWAPEGEPQDYGRTRPTMWKTKISPDVKVIESSG